MLEAAAALCTLDVIQGYWQTPRHAWAQELLTMVIAGGAAGSPKHYSKLPVDFGGFVELNVSGERVLSRWMMDDAIRCARDVDELLWRQEVLVRLVDCGLFAAAHKVVLFEDELKWFGRLYSGQAKRLEWDRVQGFVELRDGWRSDEFRTRGQLDEICDSGAGGARSAVGESFGRMFTRDKAHSSRGGPTRADEGGHRRVLPGKAQWGAGSLDPGW